MDTAVIMYLDLWNGGEGPRTDTAVIMYIDLWNGGMRTQTHVRVYRPAEGEEINIGEESHEDLAVKSIHQPPVARNHVCKILEGRSSQP